MKDQYPNLPLGSEPPNKAMMSGLTAGEDEAFDELFLWEDESSKETAAVWKLLVVDDEGDIHAMMRLALADLIIEDRALDLVYAASKGEALEILRTTPDIALVLLDVVMESVHAGLDLVRDIRDVLGNRTTQIAIITGQPGYAPEQAVVEAYDINDYRLKSELSAEKLRTLVHSALRAYRALQDLLDYQRRLKQTALALDAAEKSYRDLYDNAPDMHVSVDAETARILQCNQTLVDQLGYAGKDEIVGRLIFEMYHTDCMEQVHAAFHSFVEIGQVIDAELKLLRKDGSYIEVSLNVRAVRDEQGKILFSRSAWRDITERNRSKAALEASEERSRLLLESVAEGIIGVDPQGCCTFVNPAALRVLGYKREDFLGRKIHPLIHYTYPNGCAYPVAECPMTLSFTWGSEVRREEELLWRADGSSIFVEYSSVPFHKEGEMAGAVIIFHDISARREAEIKIKHLAFHDPLTGLSNRNLFGQELERALLNMERDDSRFALHLMDLDHFKDINDSLGHPMGDKLLNAVAERIQSVVRATDVFARFGGDEFALLQSHLGDNADASVMAAKIINVVNQEFELGGHSVRTNVSIGIVIPETDKGDADEWISRADVALYKAKEAGRGTLAFFEDTMDRQLRDEMRISVELSRAIEQEEFFVVYQPQLDLADGHLVGMEALVRWRHPQRGVVAPGGFLSVAEKRGHVGAISNQVLVKVCRQIAKWSDSGLKFGRIAVNLCAQQLRDQAFADNIFALLEAESVAADYLELEFTETVLIEADLRTQADISRLSEAGVKFAIDDFGTGFSSLQYLRKFHADKIKIDREFVQDVTNDPSDAEIVKATIALGNALGLVTIAEGVETEAQAAFMAEHGCRQAQGFLYSRPVEAEEIERGWLTAE